MFARPSSRHSPSQRISMIASIPPPVPPSVLREEYVEAVKSCHTCTYRTRHSCRALEISNSHVHAVHTNVYAGAHCPLGLLQLHNKAALSGLRQNQSSKINRELKILESGRTTFVGVRISVLSNTPVLASLTEISVMLLTTSSSPMRVTLRAGSGHTILPPAAP